MKKLIQSLFIAGLLAVSASVFAQQAGPGGRGSVGGGQDEGRQGQRGQGRQGAGRMGQMNPFEDPLAGSGFVMLDRADVQADLKLTDAQKEQVTSLRQRWAQAAQQTAQQARQNGQDMQAALAGLDRQMVAEVNNILDETQEKRFRQIRIQSAGVRAVLNASVQNELGLSTETRAKINTMALKARQEQQAMMMQVRNQQITREDAQEKMRAATEKFNTDLNAMLTDADRAKLREIGGEPFRAQGGGRPGGAGQGGTRPGRPGQGQGQGGNPTR